MQGIIPDNYINDYFYKTWYINYDFHWFIIYYFYKLINNDKY